MKDMLEFLKLTNVGPSPEMHLDFGSRLNVLTGDNGLGKSFLLDVIWWALTHTFPAGLNPRISGGRVAIPSDKLAKIAYRFSAKSKKICETSTFNYKTQSWSVKQGRPASPGLVLYAMSDGSFAVWDPARNYWKKNYVDTVSQPAYVFSQRDIWNGLQSDDGASLCNGLIRDWASWQKENGDSFENWKFLLKSLSPEKVHHMAPGGLTRISSKDVRDMPTLCMPYKQDVAIVHVSSGMQRMLALAYTLLWVWQEHRHASKLAKTTPTNKVIFLIDEIEAHLHPMWQRQVIRLVLSVMEVLHPKASVQLVTATHSPLIMTSLEPIFNPKTDAWFDLDFSPKSHRVMLEKRDFEKNGSADAWLSSGAFGLSSSRAIDNEDLINRASNLLKQRSPSMSEIQDVHNQLVNALNPMDDFLIRWKYICTQKGLLK